MELPPPSVIRPLVQRYARLVARLGDELGQRPLVLPNEEFFPDAFRPDQPSVRKLVKRMQQHAGMDDIPISPRLVFLQGEAAPSACGCAVGSAPTAGAGKGMKAATKGNEKECCGGPAAAAAGDGFVRLIDQGDSWRLQIPDAEATHSVVLTTNIARALGHVFLLETQDEDQPIDQPVEVTAELAAVALGFGVLLMEGSYIYSKSCGGPHVGRVTLLGPAELALATALFVRLGGHLPRQAKKALGTTQRALFAEANSWADCNQELLTRLEQTPQKLVDGQFEVAEVKPWLSRVLGSRKKRAGDDVERAADALAEGASVEELESMLAIMPTSQPRKTKQRDPKRDELRALVDEALDES